MPGKATGSLEIESHYKKQWIYLEIKYSFKNQLAVLYVKKMG